MNIKKNRIINFLTIILCALALTIGLSAGAQNYTVVKSFTGLDGRFPSGDLVLHGRTLYGVTSGGGSQERGTVFKVNTDGTGFSVLKELSGADGQYPVGGLLLSGKTLFGATYNGGASGLGTVFSLSLDGTDFVVLKAFVNYGEGAYLSGGLLSSANTLYGTTAHGGSSGWGTVFKLNSDGTGYALLKSFGETGYDYDPTSGNYTNSDGVDPFAGLTLSGGILYGTTGYGGRSGGGTVFKMNPDGTGHTLLKNFDSVADPEWKNSDGALPDASLIVSSDTIYGTTSTGGSSGVGTLFKLNTDGSEYTVLLNLDGVPNSGPGPYPTVSLAGRKLYVTLTYGGNSRQGLVFSVNTDGTGLTELKEFSGYADGGQPQCRLLLSGNTLYGITAFGGTSDSGTLFKITLNAAPSGCSRAVDSILDRSRADQCVFPFRHEHADGLLSLH